MSIDTQWRYLNTVSPETTFEDPQDFFDNTYTGATDPEDIKAHKQNNEKNIAAQDSFLLADKKTVITLRRFEDFNSYEIWKKNRAFLPNVDFNISEEEGGANSFIDIDSWDVGVTYPIMDYEQWESKKRHKEEEYQ